MGNFFKNKDLFATFKKHLYPKICENLKRKKLKRFPKLI